MPKDYGLRGDDYSASRLHLDQRYPATRDFSLSGTVTVGAGAMRAPVLYACRCVVVRASVATPPTGAAIVLDVNRNGTTIFSTQGNRPSIAAGANDSQAAVPDASAATFAAGDVITVDVDQVGSTVAGAMLTLSLALQAV